MSDQNCENCAFRAKYDNNPKSFPLHYWKEKFFHPIFVYRCLIKCRC
jgi:hypothetical protein